MQVITKYYLKSHLHIKRIKWMLSHLALSFPLPSPGGMSTKHWVSQGLGILGSALPGGPDGCRDSKTERNLCRQNLRAETPRPHRINCHLCY